MEAALKAFATGGKAIDEIANITPGVRKDFYPGPVSSLTRMLSISFVAAQDVTGRGIERHGGKVSRILYYKFVTDKATRYVLVYLTTDGLITDQDVVDD